MTRNAVLLSGSTSLGGLWITDSGSTRCERKVTPLLLAVVDAIGKCTGRSSQRPAIRHGW